MDYLVDPELGPKAAGLLLSWAKAVAADWPAARRAMEEGTAGGACRRGEGAAAAAAPAQDRSNSNSKATSASGRVVACLQRLRDRVVSLDKAGLFPYGPAPLIRRLTMLLAVAAA